MRNLLFFLLFSLVFSSLIGIDFGTEFVKIGLIKRGSPIDLILNDQSKRKTENLIGFEGKERFYGRGAENFKSRLPKNVIPRVNTLIEEVFLSDELLSENKYQKVYKIPLSISKNDTTKVFDIEIDGQEEKLSTYLVLTMLLKYFKKMAEDIGEKVGNAVIAVPPFYNLQQRQIIIESCELAGIEVIAIINEGTALGIQYGITKYKDVKKSENGLNVLFYDFGASSVKVSIGSLIPPKKKDSKIDLGELEMKSFSWSKEVGASMFDINLANYFAQKYLEKNPKIKEDITQNAKTFSKLLSYAKNIKKILSVNEETVLTIENIYKGDDFRMEITRKEFEEICEEYVQYLTIPIFKALEEAEMSLDDIYAIEAFGGGTRIPFVERELERVTERKLSHSLNADEAIALGATFYAASLSPMFRVKTFKIHDLLVNKVEFHLSAREGKPQKTYPLFSKYENIGVKRSINVPRKTNFSITLKYGEESEYLDMGLENGEFLDVNVKGIDSVMKEWDEKYLSEEGSKARIRLTFTINQKSQIVLEEAVATLERLVEEEYLEKVKKEDLDLKEKETDDNDDDDEKIDGNETKKEESDSSDAKKSNEDEYVKKTKNVKKYSKLVLETDETGLILPKLDEDEKKRINSRISSFDEYERQKLRLSKAKNDLESLIYSIKYTFFEEEHFFKFYTEEVKEKLEKMLDQYEVFLYDHDEDTVKSKDFEEKYNEINEIIKEIKYRYQESIDRMKEFGKCGNELNRTAEVIGTIQKKKPWLNVSEIIQLSKDLNETVNWLTEKMGDLEKIQPHENPSVTSSEIKRKCELLGIRRRILQKKKQPPKPKPKKVQNETKINETVIDDLDQKEEDETVKVEVDSEGKIIIEDEDSNQEEQDGIKVEVGEEEKINE